MNLRKHWKKVLAKRELAQALKRRNEAQVIRIQPNNDGEPSLVLVMSIPLQPPAE